MDQFEAVWHPLLRIGAASGGGYARHGWNAADMACRAWFAERAAERGLDVEQDRNGNLWAWWGEPGPGAVVTGSHLDSVPNGGAYDGPLGVVSGFLAVDALRAKGVQPSKPIAVTAFCEEEGARFGIACLGSRLLTGLLDPDKARNLTDPDGVTLATAMERAGADPQAIGRDDRALQRIGTFVELHIEQGRALDAPVGLASAIWPHGRWRFDFTGEANHAGTTRLADRRDPMLPFARTVLAAREHAERTGALATIGRVHVEPNGTNAIPSRVQAWLDARAADDATLEELVEAVSAQAAGAQITAESHSPIVEFGADLRDRLAKALAPQSLPVLPTGAGHDAGILSGFVPTAMLFVRNPTGVSHAPAEHARDEDCVAGIEALATVLEELSCR
jgi:beta-ureidopropionase / N-carbamoyl-L-amino-acid hydrolase